MKELFLLLLKHPLSQCDLNSTLNLDSITHIQKIETNGKEKKSIQIPVQIKEGRAVHCFLVSHIANYTLIFRKVMAKSTTLQEWLIFPRSLCHCHPMKIQFPH